MWTHSSQWPTNMNRPWVKCQTSLPPSFLNQIYSTSLMVSEKPSSSNAYLVHRYIRVLTVHGPECETTLLQLRLGVVPLLVDDEVLQTGEETYFGKQATIFLKKVNKVIQTRSKYQLSDNDVRIHIQ